MFPEYVLPQLKDNSNLNWAKSLKGFNCDELVAYTVF